MPLSVATAVVAVIAATVDIHAAAADAHVTAAMLLLLLMSMLLMPHDQHPQSFGKTIRSSHEIEPLPAAPLP